MTQKEKIKLLKDTITFLYEKEGRPKSYISRMLFIDRKILTDMINEWGLEKANVRNLTPSTQKFINKHRQLIKSRLDKDVSVVDIAKEIGVSRDKLRHLIELDDVLIAAKKAFNDRKNKLRIDKVEDKKKESSFNYDYESIDGEIWKPILGYERYEVSNMGRVRGYCITYMDYYLLSQHPNNTGRMYVYIGGKAFQVARLVGFSFVQGSSNDANTIDHINSNFLDNRSVNLQWVSQSKNNQLAFDRGRRPSIAHSKNGKFKQIIVDNKYQFKTIIAFSKFFEVSETQAQRYITGECRFNHSIKFEY